MKTTEEIIAYLDAKREIALKRYKEWKDRDASEASKYLTRMYTLEEILDDLDQPEPKPIAKVLATTPEEPKPKNKLLRFYINAFSLVVYFASMFFIGSWLGNLFDKVPFLDGLIGSLLEYGYYLIHSLSYFALLMNVHLLNWDKK